MMLNPVYADRPVVLDAQTMKADLEKFIGATGVPGLGAEVRVGDQKCGVVVGKPTVSAHNSLIDTSRFRISCSIKMLVGFVCAKLAEAGQIDFAAPIGTYLPELGTSRSSKGGAILVSHLLAHTSGYRGLDLKDNSTRAEWTWHDCVEFLSTTPQFFEPGTVFNEENLDYVVIGEIVRRVTRRNVQELIREMVYEPIGLKPGTATTDVDTPDQRVFGHVPNPKLRTMEPVVATGAPSDLWASALSNVTMSVVDMGTLAAEFALPRDALGVLSPIARQAMVHEDIRFPSTVSVRQSGGWAPAGFTCGCAKFANNFYGYFGIGRGLSCAIVFDPERQISMALGMNVAAGPLRTFVLDYLLSFIDGNPVMDLSKGIPITPINKGFDEFLAPFSPKQLVGQYAGNTRELTTVSTLDGGLLLSLAHNTKMFLKADRQGKLVIDTDTPIPLAFFPEPASGTPCLMLGMTTYKKIG